MWRRPSSAGSVPAHWPWPPVAESEQRRYGARQQLARCWLGRPALDRLSGHSAAAKACCLLPERGLLFTGGVDKVVRAWDLHSGIQLAARCAAAGLGGCCWRPAGGCVQLAAHTRSSAWRPCIPCAPLLLQPAARRHGAVPGGGRRPPSQRQQRPRHPRVAAHAWQRWQRQRRQQRPAIRPGGRAAGAVGAHGAGQRAGAVSRRAGVGFLGLQHPRVGPAQPGVRGGGAHRCGVVCMGGIRCLQSCCCAAHQLCVLTTLENCCRAAWLPTLSSHADPLACVAMLSLCCPAAPPCRRLGVLTDPGWQPAGSRLPH